MHKCLENQATYVIKIVTSISNYFINSGYMYYWQNNIQNQYVQSAYKE